MKQILLTKGLVALVSDEDYAELSKHSWCTCYKEHRPYAVRGTMVAGRTKIVYMHRQLTRAEKGQIVDHIDGNSLNNCTDNLRVCTQQQNTWNMRMKTANTSGKKGVMWDKSRSKWRVEIRSAKGKHYIGRYDSIEEAAVAYDDAAREYHGEFARVNYPRDGEYAA